MRFAFHYCFLLGIASHYKSLQHTNHVTLLVVDAVDEIFDDIGLISVVVVPELAGHVLGLLEVADTEEDCDQA